MSNLDFLISCVCVCVNEAYNVNTEIIQVWISFFLEFFFKSYSLRFSSLLVWNLWFGTFLLLCSLFFGCLVTVKWLHVDILTSLFITRIILTKLLSLLTNTHAQCVTNIAIFIKRCVNRSLIDRKTKSRCIFFVLCTSATLKQKNI